MTGKHCNVWWAPRTRRALASPRGSRKTPRSCSPCGPLCPGLLCWVGAGMGERCSGISHKDSILYSKGPCASKAVAILSGCVVCRLGRDVIRCLCYEKVPGWVWEVGWAVRRPLLESGHRSGERRSRGQECLRASGLCWS